MGKEILLRAFLLTSDLYLNSVVQQKTEFMSLYIKLNLKYSLLNNLSQTKCDG